MHRSIWALALEYCSPWLPGDGHLIYKNPVLSRSVRARSTFQKFSNPIHNHHAVKQDSFHHGHDCHWCRRSSRQQRYVLRYERCGKLNLHLSGQDNSVQNVGNPQAPAEQGYDHPAPDQGYVGILGTGILKRQVNEKDGDRFASMKQQNDDESDDEDDDRFASMKQQDDDESDDEDDDHLASMKQQDDDESDDEDDDEDDDRLASRKRQDDGEDDAEHPAADQGYVGILDILESVLPLDKREAVF